MSKLIDGKRRTELTMSRFAKLFADAITEADVDDPEALMCKLDDDVALTLRQAVQAFDACIVCSRLSDAGHRLKCVSLPPFLRRSTSSRCWRR